MTESNEQQPTQAASEEQAQSNSEALDQPEATDEVLNDPGKSPSDALKDSSAAQAVSATVDDVSPSPKPNGSTDVADNAEEG